MNFIVRRLPDEEARLDREANDKIDIAERAEAAAKQLEQEAARYLKLSFSVGSCFFWFKFQVEVFSWKTT